MGGIFVRAETFYGELNERDFNPMNDVAFKFIFGKEERKQITIAFLNAVLYPSLQQEIQDIVFLQTEMTPETEEEKMTRLDVACRLDTGEQVDVEVQVVNYNNMQRRTLFYWAQMYLMSLARGRAYQELRPAITINILAFSLLPQENPVAMYSIYNIKTGDRLNNDMELYFLEIPKFVKGPKKSVQGMTRMERWLAYFANQLSDREREELAMSETAIKEAMYAARQFMNDTAERRRYVNREMAILDYNSGMRSAREQGMQQGMKQGMAQGMKQGMQQGMAQGMRQGVEKGANQMGRLMTLLLQSGKIEEAAKAAQDEKVRQRLYREYGIEP